MNGSKPLLFIDFEFSMPDRNSGNKGFYAEIIEAGLVFFKNGKVEQEFSSFVSPVKGKRLTERCKSFLGISQEQVDQGMSFSDLIKALSKLDCPKKVVTWGNMDMKVLRMNCEKNHCPFPFELDEFVDLSMEYKKFFGDRNQTGLWKAVEEYGKKGTGQHHRALDDALTTMKIYNLIEKDKRYLEKPNPTTIGDRVDFSKLLNKFAT
ncbi:3'-5' exonuclease KapD [Bacillus sp. FJAT-42376]|uniref:3'-5' exonuclease KapD n=1 Tax=Bacillus sp. FJAT-42376 TaxID=2014076 RepID=UPI000F4E11BF|nr:3'-5' exonuclease KapD [Bacillus sp. FJAT-42376]AZB44218.1 3'-5' exonuclease KapD [Bacillus sp. FJAT-42376]